MNRVEKDVTFSENDEYVIHVSDDNDTSLKKLFTDKRGLSTVMFWLAAFMSLLVMYGLSTWLPKIMQNAGYPMGSSLLFLVTLNLGGVTGAIFGGKLADKFGSRKVLLVFFILGFVSLSALSLKPNAFYYMYCSLLQVRLLRVHKSTQMRMFHSIIHPEFVQRVLVGN